MQPLKMKRKQLSQLKTAIIEHGAETTLSRSMLQENISEQSMPVFKF
jgi:hypothetical protein